jgi:hypothetical protein
MYIICMYDYVYTFEQDSGWKSRHVLDSTPIYYQIDRSRIHLDQQSSINGYGLGRPVELKKNWKPLGIEGEHRGTTLPTNHFQ